MPSNNNNDQKKPVTKKTLIFDVINKYPETFDIFIEHNIGCIGCMAAKYETIEEGIKMHGIDVEKFINLLNEKINSKRGKN